MPFQLHEYQRQAVGFALRAFMSPSHGCGLFLEPGLGKTATSLAIMDVWKASHPGARFLVVAPKLVAKESWPEELEAWRDVHHLTWAVALGDAGKRRKEVEAGADVTITNQESLAWMDKTYRHWPYDGIVVDELSGFKSAKSTRTRVLRRRRAQARWCLGLTGTPAVKELLDLFAEIAVIDNGVTFGRSVTRFKADWFKETRWIYSGSTPRAIAWEPKPGTQRMMMDAIKPFCLSMKAKDKLPGMPSMIEADHWIEMPKPTRELYDAMRREMVVELGDAEVTAANAGVMTSKLCQLAAGCLYPDGDDPDRTIRHVDDAKLDALADVINRCDGPVLVFYQFTDELARMRHRFPGLREIHEPGVIDDWRAGHVPVLAAQPAAARFGLNIQAGGHEIVWLSLPWSFDDYRQANARLHRQGQTETVRVHRILEAGTVDARKLRVLQGRETLHEAVMGALKN